MSVFVWNVRGLNTRIRRRDLRFMLRKYSASFVGLVETKVTSVNGDRVRSCFPSSWKSVNNNEYCDMGRIWVCYDPDVWDCQISLLGDQIITLDCHNKGGLSCVVSVVYGRNTMSERESLWKDMVASAGLVAEKPWVAMGDFNSARFGYEKKGGRRLLEEVMRPFNDCVCHCGLGELKSSGKFWSWNNNGVGANRIAVRLDRALCNSAWWDLLPASFYEYLPKATSDHVPMLLRLWEGFNAGPKPFKIFNYWLHSVNFRPMLEEIWSRREWGSPFYRLRSKLRRVKAELKLWGGDRVDPLWLRR